MFLILQGLKDLAGINLNHPHLKLGFKRAKICDVSNQDHVSINLNHSHLLQTVLGVQI